MTDTYSMNSTQNTTPVLHNIHIADGQMLAAGARVEVDGDLTIWFAGSASGPVPAGGYIRPFTVGTTFDHWMFGKVEVVKINRKTARLRNIDTGAIHILDI